MKYLLAAGALALAFAPVGAADKEKKPPTTFEVPYRLTDTKHVLVRVKLNGKGPFNFIIDTGAPALILTEAVAKKAGGKEDGSWTTFDTLEIEGGVKIDDARGLAIDPFQLKGMNALGVAGVELHGMMGFNVLARYKIEYDFTETKLKWTPVDFKVPDPKRVQVDKNGGQGGLEMIGTLMQMFSRLGGIKPNFETQPRGSSGPNSRPRRMTSSSSRSCLAARPTRRVSRRATASRPRRARVSRSPTTCSRPSKNCPRGRR